ncbi:MAG: VOC family protein [Phycisphaerae bacterium]|nr:VOC family protein [Phycisphaerae bacterium]
MAVGASICVKGSIEAVKFYEEALGLTSAHHGLNPGETYGHVEFQRDGETVFSLAEVGAEAGDANQKLVEMMLSGNVRSIMCFALGFNAEEEVHKAFELLSKGGRIVNPITALPWSPCCFDVIDKYGVWWYIYLPAGKRPTAKEVEEFFGWDRSEDE